MLKDDIWVNINDLDEPWYPLDTYKPKYTIIDEDINEDSSTGWLLKNNFINVTIFKLF
jgi:hypothetical protein